MRKVEKVYASPQQRRQSSTHASLHRLIHRWQAPRTLAWLYTRCGILGHSPRSRALSMPGLTRGDKEDAAAHLLAHAARVLAPTFAQPQAAQS